MTEILTRQEQVLNQVARAKRSCEEVRKDIEKLFRAKGFKLKDMNSFSVEPDRGRGIYSEPTGILRVKTNDAHWRTKTFPSKGDGRFTPEALDKVVEYMISVKKYHEDKDQAAQAREAKYDWAKNEVEKLNKELGLNYSSPVRLEADGEHGIMLRVPKGLDPIQARQAVRALSDIFGSGEE